MADFEKWPSTPRLSKMNMVITEKIDGTNAAIGFIRRADYLDGPLIYAQSRSRIITPHDDNHGFACWAYDNQEPLFLDLGYGLHFGEWWGSGIQRGYGLPKGEKRFSLFNTRRFANQDAVPFLTPGLGVVPVLRQHTLDTAVIEATLTLLGAQGSQAAPGYMNPEGICVFLPDFGRVAKKTFDGDNHKGATNA
jgi:hypothetical protein